LTFYEHNVGFVPQFSGLKTTDLAQIKGFRQSEWGEAVRGGQMNSYQNEAIARRRCYLMALENAPILMASNGPRLPKIKLRGSDQRADMQPKDSYVVGA
jgi:hypothetical protein